MELIEKEAALKILHENPIGTWRGVPVYSKEIKAAIYEIGDLPTIDAAQVVRGRWILDGKEHVHCTNCGDGRNIRTQIGWKFCPSCGARMDGGEEYEAG